MVDTSTTSTNDNTRDTSTFTQSSFHWDNENENSASTEELQRSIAGGMKLIRVFEQQQEEQDDSSERAGVLQEAEDSKRLLSGILDNKYDKLVPPRDTTVVLNSLIQVLNQYVRQNQQLKLKNLILSSNSGDVQSRYEVEENLKKQQFERMKCQLFLDRENLMKRLQVKDGKVVKYKNKIIEKNREINRLMRILNEHSISDTTKINNSNNDSSSNTSGRFPSNSITKLKPATSNSNSNSNSNSTSSTGSSNSNKEKASDMLRTLGMLASQVLNDEADDDSANQTILQANNSTSKNPADCNTTEPEILHSPNVSAGAPNQESINDQSGEPRSTTSTGNGNRLTSGNRILKQLPVQMPKMKRFSTVDGTVKDIE